MISQTIESVLVVREANPNKVICDHDLGFVLDELVAVYGGERLDPLHARSRTVNELATLVQWFMTDELHVRVVLAIESVLVHVDLRDLQHGTSFEDHLNVDSLTMLEIRDSVEQSLDVKLSVNTLMQLRTIAGLENEIRHQLDV